MSPLVALQTGHTLICLFSEACVAYLIWRAVTGGGGRWMWAAMGWLIAVLISIIAFGGMCPLQLVARRIEGVDHLVQDMLTPIWFNSLVVPVTAPIALGAMAVILARRLSTR